MRRETQYYGRSLYSETEVYNSEYELIWKKERKKERKREKKRKNETEKERHREHKIENESTFREKERSSHQTVCAFSIFGDFSVHKWLNITFEHVFLKTFQNVLLNIRNTLHNQWLLHMFVADKVGMSSICRS